MSDAIMTPGELRRRIRAGDWTGPLPSTRTGLDSLRDFRAYARMNLVVVQRALAFDFMAFCQRNPRAFYISEVGDPGDFVPHRLAADGDVRTDIAQYRVYRDGALVDEPRSIEPHWSADSVFFLMGSSSSFDWALLAADVNYRTLGAFETTIACQPAGPFQGTAVVTARAFKTAEDAVRAVQISSRFPAFHGAPLHVGDPAAIGVADLMAPEYPLTEAQAPTGPEEVVMYWGCGILGRAICASTDIPSLIVHYPGRLFLTDKLCFEMAQT